jgi:hypothetical protein
MIWVRCLGVNPTANGMWLACADDGQLVPTVPHSLTLPSGMESGEQLSAMLDECVRVLRDLAPCRVLTLDPEPNNKLKFAQVRGRVTGETLLALAAARANIPCDRIGRARLRSRLNLSRSGNLSSLAGEVISEPLSPHWKGQRDLAALAALAGQDQAAHAEG